MPAGWCLLEIFADFTVDEAFNLVDYAKLGRLRRVRATVVSPKPDSTATANANANAAATSFGGTTIATDAVDAASTAGGASTAAAIEAARTRLQSERSRNGSRKQYCARGSANHAMFISTHAPQSDRLAVAVLAVGVSVAAHFLAVAARAPSARGKTHTARTTSANGVRPKTWPG